MHTQCCYCALLNLTFAVLLFLDECTNNMLLLNKDECCHSVGIENLKLQLQACRRSLNDEMKPTMMHNNLWYHMNEVGGLNLEVIHVSPAFFLVPPSFW